MPLYRTPDGKVVEKKSRVENNPAAKTDRVSPPEIPANDNVISRQDIAAPNKENFYDKQTIQRQGQAKPLGSGEEKKTLLIRARKEKHLPTKTGSGIPDFMADPVVGWLVIIDGLGVGAFKQLGYGANSIGRDSAQRVSLDYGDALISRENHACLTYDSRGRKYYLQHGGGTNLTYVNDAPVLQPTMIEDKTVIQLGETTLCFVAFCGKVFDWQDEG